MFGTVAYICPKAGQQQAVVDLMQEWESTPKVKGAVGGYMFKPEKSPGELITVAVFQDRESYFANAEDPEQDRWFRWIQELLEADPT